MEAEGIYSCKRLRRDKDGESGDMKGVGGILPWQNASSRIIRVSRLSGGKDRHSKVWTAKGLRDRRVRLSLSTATQFYDLQDRLGYDQPSKAVDWLIKAADAAIAELPELDGAFPMPPAMFLPVRAKLPERATAAEQQISPSKSTCSSASETTKGSTLSLSRCQARDRARERTEKEEENERDAAHHHHHQNFITHSSFTELLSSGPAAELTDCGTGFCPKQLRPQLAASTADYFGQSGIFGQEHKIPHLAPGYSPMLHVGNNPHMGMGMMAYNAAAGEHQEMQQFSFMQDHVIPVAAVVPAVDYDLNVSISSVFTGFNRGTLQSNSPYHHHLVDGGNLPFFFGAALPIAAAEGPSSDNQFPGGFNGRLQVCCNEAHRHPKLKAEGGKG